MSNDSRNTERNYTAWILGAFLLLLLLGFLYWSI